MAAGNRSSEISSDKTCKPLNIVIMTGGVGRTGEQIVKSALAQFDEPNVRVTFETNVRSASAAVKIVRQAEQDRAIICHTLVASPIREVVIQETKTLKIPTVDILGPILTALDDHLEAAPRNQPGLSYELNKAQFDRIDAVDFTLAHDDGFKAEELACADVVLVGVSRVSKSVTCFFLAYRGVRAANVPLIVDVEPTEELLKINPNKVIALTMNPHRLQKLRTARWNGTTRHYSESRQIARELRYANRLIAEHGWRCIDVSYKAVEEAAAEIVSMIGPERHTTVRDGN